MKKRKEKKIVGVDEAGRGPLAGPVVAVAVAIKERERKWLEGIFLSKNMEKERVFLDSKKMSSRRREEIYKSLAEVPLIEWGMGVVSEKEIDKINILEATKLAMKKALKKIDYKNARIIIDGNFTIDMACAQEAVTRADEKILECSIASVIAKVERDRMMCKYHKKWPEYGFDQNKGYGTEKHREAVKRHGISIIHRKSFNLK